MSNCSVSVVLSTYNRSALLGPAIDAVLAQASAPPYELLIIDNNSTDDTRTVVESRSRIADGRLRYIFEPRQGLSHARNTGIVRARAQLVAFTDDDVRVADDWVLRVKQAFDSHPDVDCVAGKIRPVWPSALPSWLTPAHWVGPLALQDYGDDPLIVDAETSRCLAGANFAFRTQVFQSIGFFSPDFRAEDTELTLRFWRSGRRALYAPDCVAYAVVQEERLTKEYHRRWHERLGSNARLAEELTRVFEPGAAGQPVRRILGLPLPAVRELGTEVASWILDLARGREADAFWHEGQVREIVAYMRQSRMSFRAANRSFRVRAA